MASPSLWKNPMTVDEMNAHCANTIHQALGIQFTAIGPDFIEATMPVDDRTKQPYGLLHGGASVVLAESLGSIASAMAAHHPDAIPLGIEVNANHIKAARSGTITGRVTPIQVGKTLHVWGIELRNPKGELTCTARLTVLIRAKEAPANPQS